MIYNKNFIFSICTLYLTHILLASTFHHMTQLPTCRSPHTFVVGLSLTCEVYFASWCGRWPSISDGWELAPKYSSFLSRAGTTLERVFSSDSESFPCGIKLQLPVIITSFTASFFSCLPCLISSSQPLLVFPSLPK